MQIVTVTDVQKQINRPPVPISKQSKKIIQQTNPLPNPIPSKHIKTPKSPKINSPMEISIQPAKRTTGQTIIKIKMPA